MVRPGEARAVRSIYILTHERRAGPKRRTPSSIEREVQMLEHAHVKGTTTPPDRDLSRVRDAIVAQHEFFTKWVRGECAGDDATFDAGVRRLSAELIGIMPGGKAFTFDAFSQYMRSIYASNPKFRIKIRNVAIRHHIGPVFVVNYDEWERDAKDSTPANNGRLTTMVLRESDDDFEILQVHETWLPAEVMAAGDYDF